MCGNCKYKEVDCKNFEPGQTVKESFYCAIFKETLLPLKNSFHRLQPCLKAEQAIKDLIQIQNETIYDYQTLELDYQGRIERLMQENRQKETCYCCQSPAKHILSKENNPIRFYVCDTCYNKIPQHVLNNSNIPDALEKLKLALQSIKNNNSNMPDASEKLN